MYSEWYAFVDGSAKATGVGYGFSIYWKDELIHEESGVVPADYARMGNVGAEITAAMNALRWCQAKGIEEITICYDYLGIEYWPKGVWRVRHQKVAEYQRFVSKCNMKIHWMKVDAHSDDPYNDHVDELAKRGATMKAATLCVSDDADPLLHELTVATFDIAKAAQQMGVHIRYPGIRNNHARLEFLREDQQRIGILQLYNTRRKRLFAHWAGVRDVTAMQGIQKATERILTRMIGLKAVGQVVYDVID
ncbi:MAG: RNase H family protein [Armatimonadota bacterium]